MLYYCSSNPTYAQWLHIFCTWTSKLAITQKLHSCAFCTGHILFRVRFILLELLVTLCLALSVTWLLKKRLMGVFYSRWLAHLSCCVVSHTRSCANHSNNSVLSLNKRARHPPRRSGKTLHKSPLRRRQYMVFFSMEWFMLKSHGWAGVLGVTCNLNRLCRMSSLCSV